MNSAYRDNVLDDIHMRQWIDLRVSRLINFATKHNITNKILYNLHHNS